MKKTATLSIIISLIVVLFVNSPFIYYSLVRKNGLEFLARNNINSEDTYTYVAFIEQARQGKILFENLYTSEPQKPSLFRPSYLAIGALAKLTGVSSILAYHISRIIFSLILCFIIYKFVSLFFSDQGKRLTAFTIVLTSSGLGFLFSRFFPASIDLWVPEAITFLSLEQAPHFILSLILLLTGYYFFIKFLKSANINLLVPMFFAFFALAFEHPFDLVVAIPVIFFTSLWHKKSLFTSIGLAAFSGIGLIYQVFEILNNPTLKAWNAQNILLSPAPGDLMVGLGLLTVLALVGIEVLSEKLEIQQKLIIVWVSGTALLLYVPIGFQRRFLEGIQIPLAIAATVGLYYLTGLKKSLSERQLPIVATIVIILSLGSIFNIYQDFKVYASENSSNNYYYIKNQDLAGIYWLGSKTNDEDVILSNHYFGNIIPGIIGRKVFLGHQIQTIDMQGKIEKTNALLLENNDKKAMAFLKENHITYMFIGQLDTIVQYGFRPDSKSYLKKVYDKSGTSIYKVIY